MAFKCSTQQQASDLKQGRLPKGKKINRVRRGRKEPPSPLQACLPPLDMQLQCQHICYFMSVSLNSQTALVAVGPDAVQSLTGEREPGS